MPIKGACEAMGNSRRWLLFSLKLAWPTAPTVEWRAFRTSDQDRGYRMHFGRLMAYCWGALCATATLAQGVPEPDVAKGEQLAAQVCAACHAADGNSAQAANPVLAGQHSEYTFKQLSNFKPQDGKAAERPNPIMAGMVANLSA